MALNKSELFQHDDIQLARWTKAMGHPARIAILRVLARKCTCICGDISEELPLAQSTVSQHLKALKQAGLIQGDIEGVRVCYCLNEEAINELNEKMGGFLDILKAGDTPNSCEPDLETQTINNNTASNE